MKKVKADILLLTSTDTIDSISQLLIQSWENQLKEDKRKTDKNTFERFHYYHFSDNKFKNLHADSGTSKEHEDIERAGLIVISSGNDFEYLMDSYLISFNFIFINPQLNWYSSDLSEGYELVKSIIINYYRDKTLQIKFISPILSQQNILNYVDNKHKPLVRSLPHLCLLDNPNQENIYKKYSPIHYKLIQNLEFTDKGRIATIEHSFNKTRNNVYDDFQGQNLLSIRGASPTLWVDVFLGYRTAGPIKMANTQEIIIYSSDQSSNRSGIETNINDFYTIY
jgi:hypothetical protein